MKLNKKPIIVTIITLIIFILIAIGASFLEYYKPDTVPIYTVLYLLGGVGTVITSMLLVYFIAWYVIE